MPVDTSKDENADQMTHHSGGREQRLAEVFSPCFTLVLNLRASDDLGDPESLRRRTKEVLDDAEREALSRGFSPSEIRSAKFAIVAFIDETVLSSNWSGKEKWASTPLQLELYDQYDAGEVFFERLGELRANPDKNAQILEVYYLCMTLGFKGQYQIHEQERLREIIESTYEDLGRLPGMGGRDLAPQSAPRGQSTRQRQTRVPKWAVVAGAFVFGLFAYLVMLTLIDQEAGKITSSSEDSVYVETVG